MRHFQSCDSLSDLIKSVICCISDRGKLGTAVQPARLVRAGTKKKKSGGGKIPNNRCIDVCRHRISILFVE